MRQSLAIAPTLAITLCTLLASPARAGVDTALGQHILPAFAQFSTAAQDLDAAAQADCTPAGTGPAYHDAFDAWMPLADLRIGPSETGALSVLFWPDDRGFTARTLSALIADQDPVAQDPSAYADVSIAARGLMALDMLLYDPNFTGDTQGSYTCTLVQAIAADLAAQAQTLDSQWRDGFAQTLRIAGQPGNTTYLGDGEALRALYSQTLHGLQFTVEDRLARPLGTFERPRPKRAEAWRSRRSLRNVVLAAEAAQAMAHQLTDAPLPETDAALDRVHAAAQKVSDPGFQDVTDPMARLHVEVLQQEVTALRTALMVELGEPLGLTAGFNSSDGD